MVIGSIESNRSAEVLDSTLSVKCPTMHVTTQRKYEGGIHFESALVQHIQCLFRILPHRHCQERPERTGMDIIVIRSQRSRNCLREHLQALDALRILIHRLTEILNCAAGRSL